MVVDVELDVLVVVELVVEVLVDVVDVEVDVVEVDVDVVVDTSAKYHLSVS